MGWELPQSDDIKTKELKTAETRDNHKGSQRNRWLIVNLRYASKAVRLGQSISVIRWTEERNSSSCYSLLAPLGRFNGNSRARAAGGGLHTRFLADTSKSRTAKVQICSASVGLNY